MENNCKLEIMFQKRLEFINEMKEVIPNSYPEFPVDMKTKKSQQVCRDLALKGVEEMFEALQHLKNWKPHRKTDMSKEDINSYFLCIDWLDGKKPNLLNIEHNLYYTVFRMYYSWFGRLP